MDYKSEIGIVGLGRMGFAVSKNLRDKGYKVFGFDINEENNTKLKNAYMTAVDSYEQLCKCLVPFRVIMIFVPAGDAVDNTINRLLPFLEKNDILLDCGNSYFKDSVIRSVQLEKHDINFIDVGVSGGVNGARNGACLTIGGKYNLFKKLEHVFQNISAKDGYLYIGPVGCGHLVKTIHNGIEYGFLQAIGEGLNLVKTISDNESLGIDLSKLCQVWCNGSIIESRLLSDAAKAFEIIEKGQYISGKIGGGETGNWARKIAMDNGVNVPVLDAALESREKSQINPDYSGKIIAAIRNVFGGHELP